MKVLNVEKQSRFKRVLYFIQAKCVRAHAEIAVTGRVYRDILEEFLIPILQEGPDYMLFQQDGMPHISARSDRLLKSNVF